MFAQNTALASLRQICFRITTCIYLLQISQRTDQTGIHFGREKPSNLGGGGERDRDSRRETETAGERQRQRQPERETETETAGERQRQPEREREKGRRRRGKCTKLRQQNGGLTRRLMGQAWGLPGRERNC